MLRRLLLTPVILVAACTAVIATSVARSAQPADSTVTADTVATSSSTPIPTQPPDRTGRIGLGLQVAMPAAGPSGIYNLDARTSVQVVLGIMLGSTKMITGRYVYHFLIGSFFEPFAFGEAGGWSYLDQIAFGFGAGGGVEYFIERYPAVSISLEIDLKSVAFRDVGGYDISGFAFGGGAHYYF